MNTQNEPFSISAVARAYTTERFTRATQPERDKIVRDWEHKVAVSQAVVADLNQRFGPLAGEPVLDVGFGNGGVGIAFAQAGANISGLDVEEELFAIAKKHAASYGVSPNYTLYDGTHFPFPENTFSLVYSESVLEHVDDPVQVLREVQRVLKPGKIFFLAFPNRLWPKETHTGLWFTTYLPMPLADWLTRALGHNPLKENNLHFYTFWDLKRFLTILAQEGTPLEIIPDPGSNHSGIRGIIKKILGVFGIPHQAILPHIIFALRKPIATPKQSA